MDPRVAAERRVIGALMLCPERIPEAIELLQADDFTQSPLRLLWRALLELDAEFDPDHPIDLASILEHLRASGELTAIGGRETLIALAEEATTASKLRFDAGCVARAGQLRRFVEAVKPLPAEADEVRMTDEGGVERFIDEAEEAIWAARTGAVPYGAPKTVAELGSEVVRRIGRRKEPSGIMTGLLDFDMHALGLEAGHFCVIAARPAVGKTTVGLQIADNVAQDGHRVLFASFEMEPAALSARLLVNRSGIDSARLRQPQYMSDDELRLLQEAETAIADLPLVIATAADPTPAALRSMARRAGKVELIVVDYLQYMHEPGHESRVQEVVALSRSMKQLAKVSRCPVICLAQLHRDADTQRPRISHLKESSAIEQDADQVALLWNDEDPNVLDVDFAKNRHGPTGEFKLVHERPRFSVRNRQAEVSVMFGGPAT